jgi:hypothetical protein
METDMIDKLFLELSQVTNVKTEKEMQLERLLKRILDAWSEDGVSSKNGHAQLYNRAFVKIKHLYA